MNAPAFFDLAAAFRRRFRVAHADTAELHEICYRLRHTVYCEKFAFEPVRQDCRETDEWDAHSIHCLVQNVTTGDYVGCVRLVVPPFRDRRTPLPFERVCENAIDRALADPQRLSRASIAEVSRLALIPEVRRRDGERASPTAFLERAFRMEEPMFVPCIMAGLTLELPAVARTHGIDTLFMLVERRLARYLTMLTGLRLHIIGSPVEYRGPRVPVMVRVQEVLDRLNAPAQPSFPRVATDVLAAVRATAPCHQPFPSGTQLLQPA